MALSSLRLRRALTLSTSFLRQRPLSAAAVHRSSPLPPSTPTLNSGSPSQTRIVSPGFGHHCVPQHRSFRSSLPSLNRRSGVVDDGKIEPDEIWFEGCDYMLAINSDVQDLQRHGKMMQKYISSLSL